MRHIILLALLAAACQPPPDHTDVAVSPSIYAGDSQYETLASGQTDDWDPESCHSDAVCQVSGHSSGSVVTGVSTEFYTRGYLLWIKNRGAYPIIFRHDSAASAPENRLHLPDDRDLVLQPTRSLALYSANEWSGDPVELDGWRSNVGPGFGGVVSTSTPSRSLGTAFQPSATRTTHVTYSATADCTITLSGGQEGRVEVLSDSANPPTTVVADVARCKSTGTVVLGVAATVQGGGSTSLLVPAGDYVLLRGVSVTGSPTLALTRQLEQSL